MVCNFLCLHHLVVWLFFYWACPRCRSSALASLAPSAPGAGLFRAALRFGAPLRSAPLPMVAPLQSLTQYGANFTIFAPNLS